MNYTFTEYAKKRELQPLAEELLSNPYFSQWFETNGRYLTEEQCLNELLGWLGKGLGAAVGGIGGLGRQLATGQGGGIWGGMKAGWNKAGDWDKQGGNWVTNKLGQGLGGLGRAASWVGNQAQAGGTAAQGSAARSNAAVADAQSQRANANQGDRFNYLLKILSNLPPEQQAAIVQALGGATQTKQRQTKQRQTKQRQTKPPVPAAPAPAPAQAAPAPAPAP